MSATTYFGDVVTTGNTNIVQNFVSYGATSRFTSNILGNQSIGTPGAPFGNVFAISSNSTSMNTTIQASTVFLSGNVVASNAYQGGNLFTTLMNVSGVSNTFSLGATHVGIGTSGGANLMVQGNAYVSNLTTANVSLYNLLNVSGVINTGSLVTTGIVNPVYQIPASPTTLTNPFGGTPNWGSNVYYSGDGSTMVTFQTIFPSTYGHIYRFTSNVFGGYWDMINLQLLNYSSASPTFGYAAALSYDGNTLIVGTPGNNLAGVFTFVNGAWSIAPTDLIPGSFGPGQSFGSSVAISPAGDIAVVGDPGIGAAYVYTYSAGIWSSALSLSNPYGPVSYFGYSVAISGYGTGLMGIGYTIIVGVPGYATVALYGFNGVNVTGQTSVSTGLVASDYFGYSVAISSDGSAAIIGAPYYSSGAGYAATIGPGGSLTLVSGAGAGANFGASVALSADGLTAVVGAPNASSGTGYAAKYTYSAGTWSSATQLAYAPAISQFGKSVTISSCGILIASLSEKIIFYSSLGYPTGGANLNITGDAWVSNVILTQNVYATTINAATLKTTTLSTIGIIDVGPGVSASTFEVQGNVFVSNALVTQNLFANIYSTRANVRTMNATTVTVTGSANMSPTLNVNTINVLSIYQQSLAIGAPSTTLKFSASDTNQHLGWSDALSYDGLTAIIGAPNPSGSPGSVSIYRYSGGSWNYQSGLVSTATGSNPRFGSAVSLSYDGNIALVGAYNAGFGAGYAAVYRFTGGTWGSATVLTRPVSGLFGWSVALSSDGNTAIVGAWGSPWAGVYKWNGSSWGTATALTSGGSQFGWAVSLSYNGNTAIVGAPDANSAKVFLYSGTWDAGTSLVSTAGASANFGRGVSLSSDGNTAIVGAGTASSGAGYAAIFKYTGGSWGSASQLPYSPVANDGFGYATSISSNGDIAAVFAYNTARTNQSYAVVFYNLLSGSPASYKLPPFANSPGSSAYYGGQTSLSSTGGGIIYGGEGGSFIYFINYLTSNIFASNALSSTDLSVTNTIYYNEDLTKRSLYLQPNSLNAPAIQSAISATCNAVSKSYWCTSPSPAYGNVLSVSVTSNAYSGGVYLPDGRVVFVTSNCTNIGIFNPSTSAFASVAGVPPGYNGGVLLPNGNVFFAPQTSNIGLFNPVTSKFSNVGPLSGQSYNGVLAPEGVWLTPSKYSSSLGASQIALYNNQVSYTIPTEQLPRPFSVTAGTLMATGASIAWSSGIGKFVSIINSGQSYYSSDGQTWSFSFGTTLASVDPTCIWQAVAASPTRFVATGGNGNYNSAYSTDGINWNAPSAFQNLYSINSTMTWQALAYNSFDNTFVALGVGNVFVGTDYALTPDGVTWYAQPPTGESIAQYTSLTTDSFGNQLAVTTSAGGAWYYSGGSWARFPLPGFGLTTLQSLGSTWNSVAYSSTLNIFVAVGSTGGGSNPGSAWVPAPPGAPSWSAASPSLSSVEVASEWTSVSWSPEANMFIAVGYVNGSSAGVGAYSRDGKSWYTMNPPISSLFGSKYITWSSSLGLWAIVSAPGGSAGTAYVILAADGYNTGSVLLPSGAIMFSPIGSANVMSFQQAFTYLVSNIVVGTDVFNGMVLAPNGNVITVPSGSNIYVINPTTGTSTNVGPIAGSVTNFFRGGALLPSGNVVFAPGTSANVGMFDPVALTYSNSVAAETSGIAFSGATLLPNGQVVFTPYDSANVGVIDTFSPVSQEFCLSPYFNKF
jgi:hypothetical protein